MSKLSTEKAAQAESIRSQADVTPEVTAFFNRAYGAYPRYWQERDPYSTNRRAHGPFQRRILGELLRSRSGRILDLACGEGSDAIRLGRLGFEVDAYDISEVALEKAQRFAHQAGATHINWLEGSATDELPKGEYDLVMCNGLLHYIFDKESLLERMKALVRPGGLLAVSLFSTTTPVPSCHHVIPVLPDEEGGVVESVLRNWSWVFRTYERNKPDLSHPGFPLHRHSYVKLIVRRPGTAADQSTDPCISGSPEGKLAQQKVLR